MFLIILSIFLSRSHARMSGSFLMKDHSQHSQTPDFSSPHQTFDSRNMNRQISEDEGSFSLASEPQSPRNPHRVTAEEQYGYNDNYLMTTADNHVNQQSIITMKHQDTIDSNAEQEHSLSVLPPSYNEYVNGNAESYHSSNGDGLMLGGGSGKSSATGNVPYASGTAAYEFTLDTTNTVLEAQQNGHQEPMTTTTEKATDGDDISLDATINITSTDRELEDEVRSCS